MRNIHTNAVIQTEISTEILTRFATGAFNCSPLYIPHHRLQDENVELTKSPHEFGLAVSLLQGNPNVFQDPGGPVEVL